MADFVELAAEAIDHVTDRHFDKSYDYVRGKINKTSSPPADGQQSDYQRGNYNNTTTAIPGKRRDSRLPSSVAADGSSFSPSPATLAPPNNSRNLASSPSSLGLGAQRRYKNQLPSPERERASSLIDDNNYENSSPDTRRDSRRPSSLERQSQTSERIIRAYENERDDPSRRVESVLPDYTSSNKKSNRDRDRDRVANSRGMSYANEYGGDNTSYAQRPRSQQPPRSRYYDDDEGSDYDERTGRHYRSSGGRGYDDDRDRDYDREIIETERYRGVSSSQALVPARQSDTRRLDGNDDYPSGTLAPYRRSQNDLTEVSRRSLSRGRRDYYDERDRSYSRSRSRSSRGIKDTVENLFDKSGQGIGVGIAGAVVGGLAGRHFGTPKHKNRDIVLGALIGGLGANAAENRYKEWKGDRREKDREERDDRYEQRYDGRARSSVR